MATFNEFFSYLIESGICISIFGTFYIIFLRKETFFRINRFYLLITLFLSIIIPLLHFETASSISIYKTITLNTINLDGYVSGNGKMLIQPLLLFFYALISIALLAKFIISMIQIALLSTTGQVAKYNNKKIIYSENITSSFSFINLIFLGKADTLNNEKEKIIAHELIHIRQFHSFDLLFCRLICIILWINPFVWIYCKLISEVHEYLADEGVVEQGFEKSNYQLLILSRQINNPKFVFINNFNNSIKKRIMMMSKIPSGTATKLKVLIAIPLAVLLFMSISCNKKSVTEAKEVAITSTADSIYQSPEVLPVFQGGDQAMIDYLIKNIKYPESAKEKGITGIVKVQFQVTKEGKISNATVIQSVGEGCDEEALRVVNAMPDWTPAKNGGQNVITQLVLPINFNLK